MLEKGLQGGRGNGRIRAEDAQERGHVGVDHTGAFGHPGQVVGAAGGRREREGLREEFGEGVSCADGAGCCEPGVVGRGEVCVRGGDFREDLGDRETGT